MVVEKAFLEHLTSVLVRDAGPGDLDLIQEVETLSYEHPWSRNLLKDSLDHPNTLNFVAFDRGTLNVYGFILNSIIMDEMHVLNIAVKPGYRRRGIGLKLLETAVSAGTDNGARAAFLEVRRSNIKALTLYIKSGFKVIGVRRAYYSDNREDALVMKKELSENVQV